MKKEKQKDREDRQICIVFATALLACALLTGCGAAKEDNLSQGTALVEQMDYEGALTCFEAAALNKEDLRQVYRGQGLAYMGMTDYENAAASFEKALEQLMNYLDAHGGTPDDYRITVGYGYDADEGKRLWMQTRAALRAKYPGAQCEVGLLQIGCTIAVHTGPYALGMGVMRRWKKQG